jgi:hypothetical protein
MFLSTARRSLTDFVNLTIKSVQFFGCAYRGRIYVCVFIGMRARSCMSINRKKSIDTQKKSVAENYKMIRNFLFLPQEQVRSCHHEDELR